MINITIDGRPLSLEKPINLLEAAKLVDIEIPHLCYNECLSIFAGCRLCIVEIEGRNKIETSCSVLARDGMVIHTNTERLRTLRRDLLDLLISNHPTDCLTCDKVGCCDLQDLCYE